MSQCDRVCQGGLLSRDFNGFSGTWQISWRADIPVPMNPPSWTMTP